MRSNFVCKTFVRALVSALIFGVIGIRQNVSAQNDELKRLQEKRALFFPDEFVESSVYKTDTSVFDTVRGAVVNCDTLFYSAYNAALDGYFAGTSRKTVSNKFIVAEHGAFFRTAVETDTSTRWTRVRGVYVWFSEGTKVTGAPDEFKLKVYQGPSAADSLNDLNLLYEQKFSADNWPNWTPGVAPGNIWSNPNRNLLRINTTVKVSDEYMIAVETNTGQNDDYLAFHYTKNNDPNVSCSKLDNGWRIILRDSATRDVDPALRNPAYLNRTNYRMPFFVPIVERYDSASLVIGVNEKLAAEQFKIRFCAYDPTTARLNYSLAAPQQTLNAPLEGQILDATGALLFSAPLSTEGALDLPRLAAGVYLFVVKNKYHLDVRRFIVQ